VNIPTLMTKVAALRGHPVPISSTPAPPDADESQVIRANADDQIGHAKDLLVARNVEYARYKRDGAKGSDVVLRMDITRPKSPGPHPLVVYIPGGGFVFAVKAGGARMRRHVSAAGYIVASVEYRTTRHGATYVEGITDIRAAIVYLHAHAAEYGIDPTRTAVWGESAGGYLAAMVGVTQGDGRFDGARSGTGSGSGPCEILAVIDKFGGSSLDRLAEGFDAATVAATYARGNALAHYVHGPHAESIDDDDDTLRASDPTSHVSADTPPFLIFHGGDDRLVSPVQTAILHHALRLAGADSTRYVVDGAGHGDIAVKGGEEKYWTTVPMMQLIVGFLDRTLR
jgi:acetyl esterase/lipase